MWTGIPTFSVAGTVLTGVVVAWLLASAIAGPRTYRRLTAAGSRLNLVRFYQINLAVQWLGAALVLAVLFTSPGLTAGHLGLALPSGDLSLLAVGIAAYVALVAIIGRWRIQRRVARGLSVRMSGPLAVLHPRTRPERRLAIAMSVTAGIAEELMFRGLLIAAGVGILGLPLLWSALVSAGLFAAAHLYQGPAAVGAAGVGVILTVSYVYSGSLLPAMLAHMAIDIAALTMPRPPAAEPTASPHHQPELSTARLVESSQPSRSVVRRKVRPPRPAAPLDEEDQVSREA